MMKRTYLSMVLLSLVALPGCWNVCGKKQEQADASAEKTSATKEEPRAQTNKSAGVQEVKSLEQFNAILKEGKPVIADFFAPWCGPCKRMKPIFKSLAEKYTDIIFVTVNNDDTGTSDIFKKYGVNAFPTFVFFDKSGNTVKTQQGGAAESDFDATIASTFNITVNP